MTPSTAALHPPANSSIRLLGTFQLRVSTSVVTLPLCAQKVLAFLAVSGDVQSRDCVAGHIWPESSHERAHSSLRTALWKIRKADDAIIECGRDHLRLGRSVRIDLHDTIQRARSVLEVGPTADDTIDITMFEADLVPDWDDEWLLLQRERLRQLRIHALESLSHSLRLEGAHGRSIEAAYAALAAEPLRDSAHACLIAAHLAEGNRAQATQHFTTYSRLMRDELGLAPSESVARLLDTSSV
jgi:DNA-binding SARP family transcriptional activator